MGLYGTLYGGSSSSGGGGSTPSSPALGIETTPEAIRDRIIAVIEALAPSTLAGDAFRRYRNEGKGDFEAWAIASAAACRRRFQVRKVGDSRFDGVSNTDFEERIVTFRVLVAYPQTGRDGADGALDRDDAIDADAFAIDYAIGMTGRANLAPPYPDACWRPEGNGETSRIAEPWQRDGVDFGVLYLSYSYRRART